MGYYVICSIHYYLCAVYFMESVIITLLQESNAQNKQSILRER